MPETLPPALAARQRPEFGSFFHFPVVPAPRACHESPVPLLLAETLQRHPLSFVYGWPVQVREYCPMHSHPVVELVHHASGSGVTTLAGGQEIAFGPHDTVIYPAHARHDQRMSAPGTDLCVHFEDLPAEAGGPLFTQALLVPRSQSGSLSGRADPLVRTEFRHLARLRWDAERRVELGLRVTALVLRLLALRPCAAPEPPGECLPIDQAKRYIHENYARIRSIGEIARHVGVSSDYLRHLFAARGGTALNRLLNRTRIERAKELLVHSRLPLKAIAPLTGFRTERYLSLRFRQFTGMSPGVFRRLAGCGELPLYSAPGSTSRRTTSAAAANPKAPVTNDAAP